MTVDTEGRKMTENERTSSQETAESVVRVPTWRICLLIGSIILAVSLICVVLGWTRLAGAIAGCGALCLGIYAIFREEPPLRDDPGDGGNINFGMRNEIRFPSQPAASAKAQKQKKEPKPKRSLKRVFKDKVHHDDA